MYNIIKIVVQNKNNSLVSVLNATYETNEELQRIINWHKKAFDGCKVTFNLMTQDGKHITTIK